MSTITPVAPRPSVHSRFHSRDFRVQLVELDLALLDHLVDVLVGAITHGNLILQVLDLLLHLVH